MCLQTIAFFSYKLDCGAISIHVIFHHGINKFIRPSVLAAGATVVKCIHFGDAEIAFSAVVDFNIYERILSDCVTKAALTLARILPNVF